MIFSQNTQVIYKEMQGVIDFVCDKYVVIVLHTEPQYNPPRLLVYRENFKQLEVTQPGALKVSS
jgi:hypothetical protein